MDRDPQTPPPCPTCGKPSAPRHRPFCSARCANLDLGRWLNGDYRIPADETDDDAAEANENEDG